MGEFKFNGVIGENLQAAIEVAKKAAKFSSQDVRLIGETGVGKELFARAIHENSTRCKQKFTAINVNGISDSLLESELFGHEKGSFTGAADQKIGLFESADLGTLFLDEVANMSTNMQTKILRVLQERMFRRVGGKLEIRFDVRVIVGTCDDLEAMVEKGTFREDLYYRIHSLPLGIPPLRDRLDEIAEISSRSLVSRSCVIANEVLQEFKYYSWPGNVRQLVSLVKSLEVLSDNPESITLETLQKITWPPDARNGYYHGQPVGKARASVTKDPTTVLSAFISRVDQNCGTNDFAEKNALNTFRAAIFQAENEPYVEAVASSRFKGKRQIATWLRNALENVANPLDVFGKLPEPVREWFLSITDGRRSIIGSFLQPTSDLQVASSGTTTDSDEDYGMDSLLIGNIKTHVKDEDLQEIHAVDVIGPKAWLAPTTYAYLASQLREYSLHGCASAASQVIVANAVKLALANAAKSSPIVGDKALKKGSKSVFCDEPLMPKPGMQRSFAMTRLLLWTIDELRSPVTKSVIEMHEVFRVPLFFLERDLNHISRKIDFITFVFGGRIQVYYGRRENDFDTESETETDIPGMGDPVQVHMDLLQDKKLLFAIDARRMIKG